MSFSHKSTNFKALDVAFYDDFVNGLFTCLTLVKLGFASSCIMNATNAQKQYCKVLVSHRDIRVHQPLGEMKG